MVRVPRLDYFDVLDSKNRPVLSEREIIRNLEAIVNDADKTPVLEVAKGAIGVLSTENRKNWSHLRHSLSKDSTNDSNLTVVDDALFVVCLDTTSPDNPADVCANFLCGTYELSDGIQVGSCTNRWYDKVISAAFHSGELLFTESRCSCKSSSVPMVQLGSISNILASTVIRYYASPLVCFRSHLLLVS